MISPEKPQRDEPTWVPCTTRDRTFQDLVLIEENVTDGNQWNVFVIRPEDLERDELTWVVIVEGWRRAQKYQVFLWNRSVGFRKGPILRNARSYPEKQRSYPEKHCFTE